MKKNVLSILAGIGFLAIVLVSFGNSSSSNLSSSSVDSLDFIQTGQKYKISAGVGTKKVTVLQKLGDNWVKTSLDYDGSIGYLNVVSGAYVVAN
ncbi:hypothetical protein [uncultured Lutibacter sp.]|uniref:hypothetical protein n=1 Tax=uncultured Lutibacter sp. TaxID=437739 RepID=UPI00261A3756|nr:hypothetical protein [uncultured Lutibacter sp.]